MTTKTLPGEIVTADDASMQSWAEALVARARADEVELVGTNGLLTALMRTVLQAGMEIEMTEHLGYQAHEAAGRGSGNSRNGSYPKTVTTEIGDITLAVPRDRLSTFDPVTVPKHVRRLDGMNANV
jgi:putative transposase